MLQRYFILCTSLLLAAPAARAQFSTNLPIVSITTTVPIGTAQAPANMAIINNSSSLNQPADPPQFTGMIGIKIRGNTTLPKLSYNVETWISYKNELDTSLLGMPSENDWVLMAMYPDRSLMRSLIAYHLYEQMDYWAPRMQLVELLIDGNYKGVYLFGEKIKRDTFRLDIAKLKVTDNYYPEISGGYILKIDDDGSDSWTSPYAPPAASAGQQIKFHYEYPQDDAITGVQSAWIRHYTDTFENHLAAPDFQDTALGWRSHASHKSFRDYFLLNEALGNAEGYRLNTYLWKDKSKKLRIGPPWSWDMALYNTADCFSATDTAWMYRHGNYCAADAFLPPFWWQRLQEDADFVQAVKCRYTELRAPGMPLDTTRLFAFMDSVSSRLNSNGAQARNFDLYPIFGVPLAGEPTPMAANYAEEVAHVKAYIRRRMNFLDGQWLTTDCTPTAVAVTAGLQGATLYPNPAQDKVAAVFYLDKATTVKLTLSDIFGQVVYRQQSGMLAPGRQQLQLGVNGLAAGVYYLKLQGTTGGQVTLRLIKQ